MEGKKMEAQSGGTGMPGTKPSPKAGVVGRPPVSRSLSGWSPFYGKGDSRLEDALC